MTRPRINPCGAFEIEAGTPERFLKLMKDREEEHVHHFRHDRRRAQRLPWVRGPPRGLRGFPVAAGPLRAARLKCIP